MEDNLKTLMYFRSFFVTKYSILKLDEMNKRHPSSQAVYLKKSSHIAKG